MITSLSLENFKSFQKLDNLEIKPLTILLGRNSCGKSSIIQSLLLLKQTLEENNEDDLNVEGKYLKFSDLKDISYGLPKGKDANIGYKFNISSFKSSARISLNFRNKRSFRSYKPYLDSFIHESNEKLINLKELHTEFFSENMNNLLKEIQQEDKNFSESIEKFEVVYQNFIPRALKSVIKKNKEKKGFMLPLEIAYENLLVSQFEKDIKRIKYLSPLRANPERVYIHYAKNASEINENGANCAHVLWARQKEIISFNNQKMPLTEAVHKSIELLGLSQEITSKQMNEMIYRIGIKLQNSEQDVTLADVGFGYSQVLPVILLGLLNNNDNLLLIEQPEIHLHPSSAGKLADLFLAFIKGKKKFLIETHSQELINKLRLRVIQDPTLKELINIVFISQNEDGTQINQFEIDENGMFPEWPDGFLDESENIAREILLARVGRKSV